jgi:hypothetical protein
LAGSLAWAGPHGRQLPHRYLPGSLDGRLVEVTNPADGTLWSAWAYRNGAEYDLALSFRDELGFWSEPLLIGADDGLDQTQPALAADSRGNVYLAYTEQRPDRIMLCWLQAGTTTWSDPVALTELGIRAMYPALRVVGERLVVAFRSGRGSVILDLPLLESVVGTSMNDGPDPVENRDSDDSTTDPVDEEDDDFILPLGEPKEAGWPSSTTP